MSPITLSENSVEKMQVFWPWSSFRMSACTVPRTFCLTQAAMSFGFIDALGSRFLLVAKRVELLVDRGVHEHRQDRRRRAR